MKRMVWIVAIVLAGMLVLGTPVGAQQIPPALETIDGTDGSVWERVSTPGFGNPDNLAITALCGYADELFALVRNDVSGFQLWKATGSGWTRLSIAGFTDSVRQPFLNGGYGTMSVYNGRLYVAVGSGYEGDMLYRSVGLEMWRYDGSTWQAVISNARTDLQKAAGTISGLSDCAADDSAMTALVQDATKAWSADQWAGGVLHITSGDGAGRVFDIVGNDATTLTIQQNEAATEDEYTICAAFVPDDSHPELALGAIETGDSYLIVNGWRANGFGEIWNKNVVGFAEYQGHLYLSVAHNYANGTRVWRSSDGLAWEPASEYSFGLLHGFDPDGVATGFCLVEGYEYRNGGPVCSSSTYLHASDVTGAARLFVGGTGSTGCNGRGARVFRYDGSSWDALVDYFVDANEVGTNENGFGDADSFLSSNFQAWSWADYDSHLFVGVARTVGGRVMYTATGGMADDDWTYAVGGDGPMPDGFDNSGGLIGYGINLGSHLYTYNSALWAATFVNAYVPGRASRLDGADIWRATGPADSLVWTRITDTAFGNRGIVTFEPPCEFAETLYVAGSNIFGNFTADAADDAEGALVFRLASRPDWADLEAFAADAGRFFITLDWDVDTLEDIAGYTVWVSRSADMSCRRKVNRRLTTRTSVTHGPVMPGSQWWYVVEVERADGEKARFGPLPATARKLFDR